MAEAAPSFCPYVGLDPFDKEHADYYFGRDLQARKLVDSVLSNPITVLYGASGVGKSSLLAVGLPRALGRLRFPARLEPCRDLLPGGDLARLLREMVGAPPAPESGPLIIVLDQFEEHFSHWSAAGTQDVVEAMAEALDERDRDAHFVIGIRDDALHQLERLRGHLPELLDKTMELKHLDDAGVRAAILGPVEVYNRQHRAGLPPVEVEPELVGALLQQLREAVHAGRGGRGAAAKDAPVELPYLQLALERLWEEEVGAGAPALSSVALTERLEGVKGIVDRHVRRYLDALPEREQRWMSRIVHFLVTPSGGKIAYPQSDLAEVAGASPEGMAALVERLKSREARLLRTTGEHRRFASVQLFHDVLAKPMLDWRADFENDARFGWLTDLFTGREIGLSKFGVFCGRLPRDELPHEALSSREVSRQHLLLLSNREAVDLRSGGGTMVNAEPLPFGDPRRLRDGDLVVLSNIAAFRFTDADAEEEAPSPPKPYPNACCVLINGTSGSAEPLYGTVSLLALAPAFGVHCVGPDHPDAFAVVRRTPENWLHLEVTSGRVAVEQVGKVDVFNYGTIPLQPGTIVTFGNLGPPRLPPEGWAKGWFMADGHPFELVQNGHLFPGLPEARWAHVPDPPADGP